MHFRYYRKSMDQFDKLVLACLLCCSAEKRLALKERSKQANHSPPHSRHDESTRRLVRIFLEVHVPEGPPSTEWRHLVGSWQADNWPHVGFLFFRGPTGNSGNTWKHKSDRFCQLSRLVFQASWHRTG